MHPKKQALQLLQANALGSKKKLLAWCETQGAAALFTSRIGAHGPRRGVGTGANYQR